MAGLFKLVLQMRHGTLVPSLHTSGGTTPALSGTNLRVNTTSAPWHSPSGQPRRAALNAFAINGGNGFMLVEEAPVQPAAQVLVPPCGVLLLLAERTEAVLRARCAELAEWVQHASVGLADLAATLSVASPDLSWRAAFVAADPVALAGILRNAAASHPDEGFVLGQAQRRPPDTRPIFAAMATNLCAEAATVGAAEGRARLLAAGQLFVDGAEVVVPSQPGARRIAVPQGVRFQRQRFWLGDDPVATPHAVPPGAAATDDDPRLGALREAAAAVLRLPAADLLPSSRLTRLGLDSLLAFELRSRLGRVLGATPDPSVLLSDRTLGDIAALLPAATTPAPDVPSISVDPANQYAPFPLTDIQLSYWLGRGARFALGGACHVYWEFEAEADRDPDRLEAALHHLVDTHDMLRAVVTPDGMQRVLPEVPRYAIERHAWGADAETRLAALREQMARETFDPTTWPLFHVAFSRDASVSRVHLSIDLLIIDVPSLAVLLEQWARLWRGDVMQVTPPGITFRDYVLHQKRQEDSPAYRAARDHWTARVPDLPPAPVLPGMKPLDGRTDWPWHRHRATLPAAAWREFQAHAREAGVTPVVALVTSFATVLGRWTTDPRFTLNLTVNDREHLHPDIGGVVGDFTSTILLGLDSAASVPFADQAAAVRQELATHLGHARFTGVKVLQQLGRGQASLMPVVFTSMLGYGALSGPLGRLTFGATQTPQVWLDVQAMEDHGALVVTWDAIDALFPDGLLGGMFGTWVDALQALATDPAAWQRPLRSWLDAQETVRRVRRNATDHPVEPGLLHEPFLRHALAHPDRIAVIAPDRTLTHGALLAHAAAVARAIGPVPPDHLVAVVMPKGWRQVAAAIGVLMTGGAYLPIDPALPPARQHHLRERGEARTVLTLSGLGMDWPAEVNVIAVDQLSPTEAPVAMPARPAKPTDLAYVIFTSGSTGEPKGVMIEHHAALNTVLDVNDRFAVGATDCVLGLSSLSFDLSVWDIFGVLGAGGALVLPDSRSIGDPAHLERLLREHGVTIWNSVPMFVQLFMQANPPTDALATLRLVMMSGDWIPVGLPPMLKASRPGISVVSLGGATEASIWSIAYGIGDTDPAWSSIPYGYPMRNQRFHVLDEHMDPCPDWVPGELYIAGVGLARGYWRDKITTDARFVTHPATGERLYRTGDMGRYRDDGVIEFLGRSDGQVKIGGYRIELGEIDAALGRHPGVRHAAVVVKTDSGGHRSLAAFYVADAANPPDTAELRRHLSGMLPAYMVPALFHRLDAMPLNANEKVDRKALAAWEPADEPSPPAAAPDIMVAPPIAAPLVPSSPAVPAVPAAEFEPRILEIWREILGNPLLPADAKLFEHGAHSFHAVDANTRINRALNAGCTVTDIFEFVTVRDLARALATRVAAPIAPGSSDPPPETRLNGTAVNGTLLNGHVVAAHASRGQRRRQFRTTTSA
ncbi:MAG: amino acid adenylation domain-containing protein [Acetobacteraceae bacterium]